MFHLVDRSPWPFFMALSIFLTASGLLWWMHRINFGGYFLLIGFFSILLCMYVWWRDIVREGTFLGHHTKVVSRGLKLGFKLFILSEVMFFFGFFWAYFSAALSPTFWIGCVWPPLGYPIMDIWATPFLNTIILIVSGASITWAHRAVCQDYNLVVMKFPKYFFNNRFFRNENKKKWLNLTYSTNFNSFVSFAITCFLGIFFLTLQVLEYNKASFSLFDGVMGSAFYSLTGLHGVHVTVGLLFIIICFIRYLKYHYTKKQHIGFVFAIWYWHFVDVVWLFLFIFVYIWGNGFY